MALPKPEYHLENVFLDGTSEPCQVMNVADAMVSSSMSRRGFVGAGVALSAVVSAMGIDSASAAEKADVNHVHAHLDQISGLVVLPQDKLLISSSWDKLLKVWKLPSGELSTILTNHADSVLGSPVLTLAQSPDGKYFVSGDKSGEVNIWDSANQKKVGHFDVSGQPVLALLFTLGGYQLAVQRWDGGVIMESFTNYIEGHADKIRTDKMKLDNFRQVSRPSPVSVAGIPNLLEQNWKITQNLYKTLSDRKTGVTAFSISLQGNRFAYADNNKVIHVHDTALNKSLTDITRKQPVDMLVMNRSGKYLAAAHKNRSLIVTDLELGTDSPEMVGHSSEITAMTLTDDGQILAVGHSDGAIALWKVESGTRYAFCFDRDSSARRGVSFKSDSMILTQPCGTPLPPNATCTCNCVSGTGTTVARSGRSRKLTVEKPIPRLFPTPIFFPTGGGCSCVPVCSCIPVFR